MQKEEKDEQSIERSEQSLSTVARRKSGGLVSLGERGIREGGEGG